MEVFLGKVTQQAMNYAIRSGITITASYAIKQTSRLLRVRIVHRYIINVAKPVHRLLANESAMSFKIYKSVLKAR